MQVGSAAKWSDFLLTPQISGSSWDRDSPETSGKGGSGRSAQLELPRDDGEVLETEQEV